MDGGRRARPVVVLAAMVVVALAVIAGRASYESARSYGLGEAARAQGASIDAAYHYRHAAQWLTPLGRSDDRALERLVDLGDERLDAGDVEGALFCWRSARSAIMATRHLATPHVDVLDRLHPRIAGAMATQRTDDADERVVHESRYRDQLDGWRERQVSPWHALGASVAFVLWIASLALAGWTGLTREGRIRTRPLAGWLVASAGLFATWWLLVRLA